MASDEKNVIEELYDSSSSWEEEFEKLGKALRNFYIEKERDEVFFKISGECVLKEIKIDGIDSKITNKLTELLNESFIEIRNYQEGLLLKSSISNTNKK
jgi:hypothetical protein